jgi:hypothetical protein
VHSKRFIVVTVIAGSSLAASVLAGCTGAPAVDSSAQTPSQTGAAHADAAGSPLAGSPLTASQAPEPAPSSDASTTQGTPTPPANPSGLPGGLKTAIVRDLHITPDQYLAGAQAAASAPAAITRLADAGIDPSEVWLAGSVLKVHTASPQQAEAATAIGAEPTSSAPPSAPPVTTASSYEDLVNGTGWYLPVSSTSIAICSTGFNGWNSAGAATVATAGHCLRGNSPVPAAPVTATRYVQSQPNQSGTSGSTIGTLEYDSFQFGGGFDSGLIDVANAALTPKPASSTWDGSTVPVRGTITATVGAYVCKSGRTTGWSCGTVQRVNYAQGIDGGYSVNSVQTSMCMYHGDSGGPAMIGFYAVGVNSSGTWSSAACTDSSGYSAIYPVQGSPNSITAQQTGWEPMVTVDAPVVSTVTPGTSTVLQGTLPNVATGDSVSVYIDGGTVAAATGAVDASSTQWTLTVPAQAAGAHTYRVVAGWGVRSRSTAVTGSYTVGTTPTPTPAPTATPTPTPTPTAPGGYAVGSFIKSPSNSTVYVVASTSIRPVSSWAALLSLTPKGTSPMIQTVPASTIAGLEVGPLVLTVGSLVRSPTKSSVYLVDGLTDKIPVATFDFPASIGITGTAFVSDAVLAGYPTAALMGYGIVCGGTDYVAASGALRALDATTKPLYPLAFTSLDAYTCALLTRGAPATAFIRTPNGSIYQLVGGTKRPIASMARFYQLGGSVGWVDVTPDLAATIPSGPYA